jgi:hypothetical protein
MTRTRAEVGEAAKNLVNRIVADLLMEFDPVRKAVDRVKPSKWAEAMDAAEENAREILIDLFGVSE